MSDLIIGLVVALIFAVLAYVVGAVVPWEWMTWWVAGLIGVVVSFGGWLIVVGDIL